MLTTTRMLLAMVVVKVVMLTVMILMVMTRRMTKTTTKYGLRDRGHELFYRLISRKKIEVVFQRKTGVQVGPVWGLAEGLRTIRGVFARVLEGYW